jgi:CDP-glucose 4,6-dehydratase
MADWAGALENMVMGGSFWHGKRVLITGHTGFKGSWLSLWLARLGAEVEGFALSPPTDPSCFEAAGVGRHIQSHIGDIRDADAVLRQFQRQQPEIVFHLAAQPLVRLSHRDPVGTYLTNVMGTVHVLDAARRTGSARVIVAVTSDKCYENREQLWGYREHDAMGGYDPYSSSKGCAELVAAAYRRSYFESPDRERTRLATARAGNVIGGGDWAEDRLVPDCLRALGRGETIVLRRPNAVRPWQHVMEPLAGYLTLAQKLWQGDRGVTSAYNFGPYDSEIQPVSAIVGKLVDLWGSGAWKVEPSDDLHEAGLLALDSTLARTELGWRPRLSVPDALALTVEWFRAYQAGCAMDEFTCRQIAEYEKRGESPVTPVVGGLSAHV